MGFGGVKVLKPSKSGMKAKNQFKMLTLLIRWNFELSNFFRKQ